MPVPRWCGFSKLPIPKEEIHVSVCSSGDRHRQRFWDPSCAVTGAAVDRLSQLLVFPSWFPCMKYSDIALTIPA